MSLFDGHIIFYNMLAHASTIHNPETHYLRYAKQYFQKTDFQKFVATEKCEAPVIIELCAQKKAKSPQGIIAPCDIAKNACCR